MPCMRACCCKCLMIASVRCAVKDLEAVIADEATFAALPEEEQAAKQQELQKKRARPFIAACRLCSNHFLHSRPPVP